MLLKLFFTPFKTTHQILYSRVDLHVCGAHNKTSWQDPFCLTFAVSSSYMILLKSVERDLSKMQSPMQSPWFHFLSICLYAKYGWKGKEEHSGLSRHARQCALGGHFSNLLSSVGESVMTTLPRKDSNSSSFPKIFCKGILMVPRLYQEYMVESKDHSWFFLKREAKGFFAYCNTLQAVFLNKIFNIFEADKNSCFPSPCAKGSICQDRCLLIFRGGI